jgi:hypothetical protein
MYGSMWESVRKFLKLLSWTRSKQGPKLWDDIHFRVSYLQTALLFNTMQSSTTALELSLPAPLLSYRAAVFAFAVFPALAVFPESVRLALLKACLPSCTRKAWISSLRKLGSSANCCTSAATVHTSRVTSFRSSCDTFVWWERGAGGENE